LPGAWRPTPLLHALQFDAQHAELKALKRDMGKALRDRDVARAKLGEVLEGLERQEKEAAKAGKEHREGLRACIKGLE
jgi:hypothetical protein